jgi:beta-phosphoglucomutase-like phosphatase (HAD superfamily)
MTDIGPFVTLSPRDYDAVLFDLDGVLTRTASVHAAAWKKLFNAFLEQRAAEAGKAFVSFEIDADYRRYVDGKPRYDGVSSFLASRGIALPFGTPADGPEAQTLRAQEINTAVVSSSNNCAAVLEAAGISKLFDARCTWPDESVHIWEALSPHLSCTHK